jgi:hypothetical protein
MPSYIEHSPSRPGAVVSRDTMKAMIRAALGSGEPRFARQAALAWLSAFPGDMEVTLYQAQAVISEGRRAQALPALELVCRQDPFWAEAYQLLASASSSEDLARQSYAAACLKALGVQPQAGKDSPVSASEPWAGPTRQVLHNINDFEDVSLQSHLQNALRLGPDVLLVAAAHLLVVRAGQDTLASHHLARLYHTRWPDCLLFKLVLAETHLEIGDEPEAVRLLHLCAAKDAAGQVATRLWGPAHPYRSLWPEGMAIHFDLPVPAVVAAKLGWNRLSAGPVRMAEPDAEMGEPLEREKRPAEPSPFIVADDTPPCENAAEPVRIARPDDLLVVEGAGSRTNAHPQPTSQESNSEPILLGGQLAPADAAVDRSLPEEEAQHASTPDTKTDQDSGKNNGRQKAKMDVPAGGSVPPKNGKNSAQRALRALEAEFERLASRLKQPELARMDGRFPVYLILSSRQGLVAQYGPRTAEVLDAELRRLAGLIRSRQKWGAFVYYPDDPASTSQFGLQPLVERDPWKFKHAIADLDAAMERRGERIGALLIVGGDTIVPFHRLPNPTDDADADVPSDSPYATLDANYFVPEWPVGRLPGECGPRAGQDAGLLLEQIRAVQREHSRRSSKRLPLILNWHAVFGGLLNRFGWKAHANSFGYTAAAWRRSSLVVFRPIGQPHTVLASPPEYSGSFDPRKANTAGLAYFNLHGLEDSPAWYGQRDLSESTNNGGSQCQDYPVALTTEDLRRGSRPPRIVFSEACYGGHVMGKCENESLALKFLSIGTTSVIASTCISYGSVNTPLVAADLLGRLFWQHLRMGSTAGQALMQAKIELAREMERRQGFLDGEDQKTLISFVLYGDPLTTYDGFQKREKVIQRPKTHQMVKTVSDRSSNAAGGTTISPATVSPEALKQVKNLLAEYLPGVEMADLRFSSQYTNGEGQVSRSPAAGQKRKKNGAQTGGSRLVVTASKQVQVAQHVHRHYFRVTLDEAGKPVKMSMSR